MAILAITICLSSLLLAGCSSSRSALSTIHLVELSYRRSAITSNPTIPSTLNSTFSGLVGNASMTVRVGYFGLCTRLGNEGWICHKDASSFATSINAAQDPLNLISNCMTFRSSIIFSGLVYARSRQSDLNHANEIPDSSRPPLASFVYRSSQHFQAGTRKSMI